MAKGSGVKGGARVLTNQKAVKVIKDYNSFFLAEECALELLEPLDLVGEGFPFRFY